MRLFGNTWAECLCMCSVLPIADCTNQRSVCRWGTRLCQPQACFQVCPVHQSRHIIWQIIWSFTADGKHRWHEFSFSPATKSTKPWRWQPFKQKPGVLLQILLWGFNHRGRSMKKRDYSPWSLVLMSGLEGQFGTVTDLGRNWNWRQVLHKADL